MVETQAQADDRIIRETGTDARIALLIRPLLDTMGYRLVRVRLSGQNGLTLQIMAERLDGTMTVQDCEEVSKAVSPLLDVEDTIEGRYFLEVSSPGVNRRIRKKEDFEKFAGSKVKIRTRSPMSGRRNFTGTIEGVEGDGVLLRDEASGSGQINRIPLSVIEKANLQVT